MAFIQWHGLRNAFRQAVRGDVTQQTPCFANVGLAVAHVTGAKVAVSGLHFCADTVGGQVELIAGSEVVKADDALAQFEQTLKQVGTDESSQPEIELGFRVGCETGLDLAVCGRDAHSESREARLLWSRKSLGAAGSCYRYLPFIVALKVPC